MNEVPVILSSTLNKENLVFCVDCQSIQHISVNNNKMLRLFSVVKYIMMHPQVVVAPANDLYNQRVREVVATRSTAVMSEVVTLLTPQTLYVVYLTAVNLFGEGPATEQVIQTQRKSKGR